MTETAKVDIQRSQSSMWAMKSMVFNSWLNKIRSEFNKKEVRHIAPYKDVKGELSIRVIYTGGFKPVFFTIPNNLDLNPSDWDYLESQIRENIPGDAD